VLGEKLRQGNQRLHIGQGGLERESQDVAAFCFSAGDIAADDVRALAPEVQDAGDRSGKGGGGDRCAVGEGGVIPDGEAVHQAVGAGGVAGRQRQLEVQRAGHLPGEAGVEVRQDFHRRQVDGGGGVE